MASYVFQQGETFRIPLILEEGDKELITNVRANLKLTVGNKQTPPLTVAPAAVFTVVDATTGWILQIAANITATLKPGLYVVNAAMEISGTTIITDSSYIKVEPSTII